MAGREKSSKLSYDRDLTSNYTVIRELTGGALNGGIAVVKRKRDGLKCVQKNLRPADVRETSILLEEFKICAVIEHPNIIEFLEGFVLFNIRKAAMFIGFCDGGDLHDLIKNHEFMERHLRSSRHAMIPEVFIRKAFVDLTKALLYLQEGIDEDHPKGRHGWLTILHRDIKPDNILLKRRQDSRAFPHVVLADFGLASRRDGALWNRDQMCGTPIWRAPEIEHSRRAEMFSVGLVIQAMALREPRGPGTGIPPGTNPVDWLRHPKQQMKYQSGAGALYSESLNKAIKETLIFDRAHRPYPQTVIIRLRVLFKERVDYIPLARWAMDEKLLPNGGWKEEIRQAQLRFEARQRARQAIEMDNILGRRGRPY